MSNDTPTCALRAHWALLGMLAPVLLIVSAAQSPAQETWTPTNTVGAPSARRLHTAVWTGSKMIVWAGSAGNGGIYEPTTDTWTPAGTSGAPGGRIEHTVVWTGTKMIIWGGESAGVYVNTGGVYDPTTNSWTPTSTVGAPSGRKRHSAVWTGTKMIVWGGTDRVSGFPPFTRTGAAYDPATNTWTPTSTTGAPTARSVHTAVWTGTKMIVWGGSDSETGWPQTGAAYDPATNTWTPMTTVEAPSGRGWHTALWTGTKMIVWGGTPGYGGMDHYNTGGIYDPATDTWSPTSLVDVPYARYRHTAVWTGTRMIIWGGAAYVFASARLNTGGIYDPATNTWTATSLVDVPYGRADHTAVWTGTKMIIWGGEAEVVYTFFPTNTGGVYSNPAVLPPPAPPADFYTVNPCRLVDTRNAAGPTGGPALYAGAVRTFPATGGVCGIPSTATAVSVNVTVVTPAAQGNLTLYRGDATSPPLASNINFAAGQTRANNAIVLLSRNGGTINVKNGSAGSVHFVLDVNGYFE